MQLTKTQAKHLQFSKTSERKRAWVCGGYASSSCLLTSAVGLRLEVGCVSTTGIALFVIHKGLPQISNARNIYLRVFWSTVVMVCFIAYAYFQYTLVAKYFSYPVSVQRTVKQDNENSKRAFAL